MRTRFAPSPTGSLHVGNARIAVLNWLLARRHDGSFVLRIEDTDVERNVSGSETEILEDLAWLGLYWQEGPDVGGPYGPYRQSERLPAYREAAARLLAAGHAFRCYCTEEELEAQRQAALARRENPHYSGSCRRLSGDEAKRREAEGHRFALRFAVPAGRSVLVRDVVRGEVRFAAEDIGDFVILRSDGLPTYNFAVVVDDIAMRITHVVRGVGHLSNTPRQLLLYEALGAMAPEFAHVPTVLGPDRQKLSKRHGARALAEYRTDGYHADAVVNYLSLLSWASPSGQEVLSREQLVAEVSLERVGVADVVFDPVKLLWLSGKHIEGMAVEALIEAVQPFVDRERYPGLTGDKLAVAVHAVRSHLSIFSDINGQLEPFVPLRDDRREAVRGLLSLLPGAPAVILAARELLADLERWDVPSIDAAIRAAGPKAGVKGRALYEPLRLALTGEQHGPPLAAVAYVQGREAALAALDAAL